MTDIDRIDAEIAICEAELINPQTGADMGDDRSTPVRLIVHKDTILSICECGGWLMPIWNALGKGLQDWSAERREVDHAAMMTDAKLRHQDDDRGTPVRLIFQQGTLLSICECGEETAGPNFCGYCGHPIEWDNNPEPVA